MSDEFRVLLPKLGESILNATIVQWFKKEGDPIAKDEALLEVATDKVNSEIPSPVSGIVKEILAGPDQEMNVGDLLVVISLNGKGVDLKAPPVVHEKEKIVNPSTNTENKEFFSPALLRLAREKGIALSQLEKVSGTGEGGRVTKKDLECYLEKSAKETGCPSPKIIVASDASDIERMKMSKMRKAIADNMVRSFYEAPHATLISEVDVTKVMQLIKDEKEEFFEKNKAKLTITSFVARAISRAIQEYPLINSSLEEDTIVLKRFVNIGMAVSVDQGVMVPVIKQCQKMMLSCIAKEVQELSQKTRAGELKPEDVQNGTITMTNFGMSGALIGVPIIRFPEVAIVGIGAIHKKVVVLEDDSFAIRSMMHVSLTFDHRVLDGMYGCGFLAALKKHLETDIKID
ncbi:MAG TPA: dihydrolipoamide acetyltransferase family protein [Rhabdochlamydiaceae bacterium]|nr:dihydrolipoamide acetyltransferase family protein [Rhabdochlamydiaceae bacterium]